MNEQYEKRAESDIEVAGGEADAGREHRMPFYLARVAIYALLAIAQAVEKVADRIDNHG